MRIPICVRYAACMTVLLCLFGTAAAQSGPGLTFGTEDFKPQPINMYLYQGEEGGLAVEEPLGNTTVEVECPGHPTPRVAGYYVGTWASRPVQTPVEIDEEVSCELWAYSVEQAANVRFNVEFYVNGAEMFQFETQSTSLSSIPEKITGSGQGDEPLMLETGDIISVRLAYFSDPRYPIGPGADSTLIMGDVEYDSHIKVTASPLSLEIQEPTMEPDVVTISAYINDSFAATRYYTGIRIYGRSDVEAISEPTFTREGNATIVSWTWDYRTDDARDGEYRVSITVSYTQDNEFTAVETYDIEFVEPEQDCMDFGCMLDWSNLILIVIVIAVIAAVCYKIIQNKRSE